jgi:hypothetical protein
MKFASISLACRRPRWRNRRISIVAASCRRMREAGQKRPSIPTMEFLSLSLLTNSGTEKAKGGASTKNRTPLMTDEFGI